MTWNKAFTIALVQENEDEIEKLLATMPSFSSQEEMIEAQALIKEALILFSQKKDSTHEAMQKLKKTRSFVLSSTLIQNYEREYRG